MSCIERHPWAGYLVTSGAEERIDVRSGGAGSSAQAERRSQFSQFRPHVTESDAGLGTVDLTSERIPLHTRNSLRGICNDIRCHYMPLLTMEGVRVSSDYNTRSANGRCGYRSSLKEGGPCAVGITGLLPGRQGWLGSYE